jgi:hypothetical protein
MTPKYRSDTGNPPNADPLRREKYDDQYEQVLEAINPAYKTMRDAKYVCNHVRVSHRRDTLTFSHHQEVASSTVATVRRFNH